MKIALIMALQKEYDLLKDLYDFRDDRADLNGHTLILSTCGMGKVNAAMTAQKICQEGVDLILSVGVAGGLDSSLKQGDVLISTRVAYHDVWCGTPNLKGQVQNLPLYFETPFLEDDSSFKKGLMVTGDQFVTDEKVLKQIKSDFPDAMSVDMESAAIAQVCYLNHVNFASIRMISDVVGVPCQEEKYFEFWKNCPENLAKAVQTILQKRLNIH